MPHANGHTSEGKNMRQRHSESRVHSVVLILLLMGISLLWGCPSRISSDPNISQQTIRTARTLAPLQMELGAGFLIPRQEDMGVSLPVRVGLPHDLEGRTNAAHLLMGVPNLALEYKFHEDETMIWSTSLGGTWVHPPYITILPDAFTDSLGSIHIFSIPLDVIGTFPFSDWLEMSARMVYTHSSITGSMDGDSSSFSGSIGTREFAVEPSVSIKTWDFAFLNIGVEMPLWAVVPAQAGGQVEAAEGVIIGVDTQAQQQLDVLGLTTTYASLEFHYGDHTRLRLYGTWGMRFLESRANNMIPGMELYWRF